MVHNEVFQIKKILVHHFYIAVLCSDIVHWYLEKIDLDCDFTPIKIKVNIPPPVHPAPVNGYVGGLFITHLCKTM